MIGSKLADRYELTAELGRGGMGVVYRALDPLLGREVAVKLIPPALLTPEAEQRFQREAQIVAQMDHPQVVSIYDVGRHEGAMFFVMPLVQGLNLHAYRRQRSALGDVVDIAAQVADALEYSHRRGVIHRDIKPENIMVSQEGGAVRVRVMDFGLARSSSESRLTKSGALVGTLSYLSPEQVIGRAVDPRSDVYSLGTVLYECIVGTPPFTGDTQSVLYRIVHEVPQGPRSLGAEIDEELDRLVLACLEKEPARRPQSAGEVAEVLRRYRSHLGETERERPLTGLTLQAPRPALAPFVGRSKEFGELQQRLNAALAGECQFAVVSGEPGIGKTRLLDELQTLAKVRHVRTLQGRSSDQERSLPYQGFCELIQEYFRQVETSSSTPPPDMSDLAGELVALFPMLNEVAEVRSAAGSDPRLSPERPEGLEGRTQIFELLARTLTRLGGGRPLLIVLEDLHGADVSLEALPYIVRRLGPTPTLVVGSYRSTEVDRGHPLTRMLDGFAGDRRFVQVALGPLSASDHRQYLETLVGGGQLSDALSDRLYAGAEGNPFFTKELVRSLLDSGGISRDDTGEWSLSGATELSADAMPATIQQVVAKRVEGLPDEQREVLSAASVIGKSFESRELEALFDGRDVDDALDKLIQHGLVEEERESRGDRLSFSSGVVRDVLYAGLTRRRRRSLHRRYAELLEKRHGGRLERVLPQLVHHCLQGDVPDKTVEFGLRLARASLDAFSPEEAARAARTALEFLDEEWEGERAHEGEARWLLARAQRMSGDIDGALREAEAAARIFEHEKQPARAVDAMVLAAESAWQVRRTEETTRWVERGLAAARPAGASDGLRQLLSLAATLANLRGDYAKANEYLAESTRLEPESRELDKDEKIPAGGLLVVGLANPLQRLEPYAIETNEELEIAANVYETLLTTDVRGNLVGALCDRWEGTEDGRSFRVTLSPGVRFSDGHPVTAADVKASFETSVRLAAPELAPALAAIQGAAECRARSADSLEGVAVFGEHLLEIRLTEPMPIYPALLSDGRTGILRALPGADPARPRLLGTGPFVLTEQPEGEVTLERNAAYWRQVPVPLDGVRFRILTSATEMTRRFRSGELDLARDLLPQELEDLLRDPRFRRGLVETPKKNTYFVLFSSRNEARTNPDGVRRALSGVVRTTELVWRTLGRFAQPAVCLIPPGMLGHDAGRRNPTLSQDAARKLLGAAGVEGRLSLRAAVHPLLQDRYSSLLEALFATWSEIGVDVEIETKTMGSYLEAWDRSTGLDLLIGRWNADYDDPDNFTHTLFHSQSGLWRSWLSSDPVDRLLDEARAESRPAVRETLYRRLEGLFQETAALLPLFHDIDYRLVGPKVRGLRLRGTAPYVNYPQIGKLETAEPEAEVLRPSGGLVQVPITGVVQSLDPALMDTFEQGEVLPLVYECLTKDVGGARIVPWLAAEVRAEEDGRRYRFRLRDDVRFHDGRRVGARDVRYSYERLLQSSHADGRWMFASIKGGRALLEGRAGDLEGFRIHSALEFSIELEEPVAFFPALVSFQAASIVPEGTDPGRGPEGWVGTGPFRVVSFQPGQRIELERHKTYWRKGFPRSEAVVFSFGVSAADVLKGFREGRFSLASDLLPADVEALRRDPDYASKYREVPRLGTYYVAFNTHRGPLTDRRLRERLVGALDVPRLVQQTVGRLAVPARSFIPPGLLGHAPSSHARSAAAPVAGPDSGAAAIELTAVCNPVFLEGFASFTRELTAAWRARGFELRIVNRTIAEFLEAVGHATVDVVLGRWLADYPDPDTFAQFVHSNAGLVGRLCGHEEIDRIAERGRTEPSAAVRHALYREFEEILAREALMLPLFHEQAYRFARPEIEGLSVSFGTPTVAYEDLRVRG